MTEKQHHLQGITIPAGHDIRIEACNLLTAIMEHDTYLDCFERGKVEEMISILDGAREREEKARGQVSRPGFYTGLMDPVIPAGGHHG